MKIFVYGWYDHGNIGDESYKLSFAKIWPGHTFFFGEKVAKEDWNEYDLCIIGGGDVVRESSLGAIESLNCPKIALSVTITDQSLCDNIHSLEHIFVRDQMSFDTLKKFGYNYITYIPDISVILEGDKKNGKQLIKQLFADERAILKDKVYTIAVNSHLLGTAGLASMRSKTNFDKMVYDLAEMIDQTDASFLFIPFSTRAPWDDRVVNGLVRACSREYKKNCMVYNKLSVQESIDIIAASDLLITSRFHGLVFGIGNAVPTVTISFHDKFAGFCKTIDQDYIDYYSLNLADLKRHIARATANFYKTNDIKNTYIEKVRPFLG